MIRIPTTAAAWISMAGGFRRFALGALALTLIVLSAALPSLATTFTVTDTSDNPGDTGSLRHAVNNATNGDTITFSLAYPATITLDCADNGPLAITQGFTISGPGAAKLAISGANACTVFTASSELTATISGVTIENGFASGFGDGGGIENNGTLTVSNCTLSGNSANDGGGIYNIGEMTVNNSTLSGNSTPGGGDGGGIYNTDIMTLTNSTISGNSTGDGGDGGGIYNEDDLTVINSTFSGNSANGTGDGGAIYNDSNLTMSYSTLSGNSASGGGSGGGIYNEGTLTLKSTLLASESGGNCSLGSGNVTSDGYNLSDDNTCTFLTATGDQSDVTNAATFLGPLQNNGGPTNTIALLTGSTAIDKIPAKSCTDAMGNAVTADQRGVTRPQGASCDIGAFELTQGAGFVLTTAANPSKEGKVSPASGMSYPPGTVVALKATAKAGYAFISWTGNVANPNSAKTTITMIAPESVTANFGPAGNVTINTSPQGLEFSADGTTYRSPITFTFVVGTMHSVATVSPQSPLGFGQYVFANWSDGGAISHTITVSAGTEIYTANFVPTQLTVLPELLSFGNVALGNSATQVVALANNTGQAVTVGPLTISASMGDPSQFTVSSGCPALLQNLASCAIGVTFAPDAIGKDAATLNIADSDTGSPLEVTISAAGTKAAGVRKLRIKK